jgi:nucleoside-diphosphate-sugar epimerase
VNILITGSTGVVGTSLREALSAKHRISGLPRALKTNSSVDILTLTDRDIGSILTANRVDIVIHCAADITTATREGFYLNSCGMQRFVAHPIGRKKRHILIGSVAEYGQTTKPVKAHALLPAPQSHYGASKLLQTALGHLYRERHHVNIQMVRLFSIISPRVRPQSFIGHMLEQTVRGSQGVLSLDNDMKHQDFIDMRDVCAAVALLVERQPKEYIYEIGTGRALSFARMIKSMSAVLHKHKKPMPAIRIEKHAPLYTPPANITPLTQEYGWRPLYSSQESLEWCLREKGYA